MEIREHHGYGHGLRPDTTSDINCPSCREEDARTPRPFHSYSFDVWTDQPGQASLPMVVTRYGLDHETTLAAVRRDLRPGILVTPRTHNRARCCPPHFAVRGSTRDEHASPAPELTAYLRECYPQLAEASSRRYDDPHTAI